ncbi:MAG TPA: precorrin-6A/cobalt-precorrin-6A reductase [Geminicoccaceae bacterium]|nr:precorrin-6A/cobalt-precorrin-6A reductase [Geminicoccus sp.]HMU51684.1 precorrin-6A/cobalt-precorrin-6A reductase [Geminicoccaceae bacterium]
MILGTTGEARRLADLLAPRDEVEVISSAGGASSTFGGTEDLMVQIAERRPAAVIDATHAYSPTISRYARRACAAAGVPRLRFERPAWSEKPGDDWRLADDLAGAVSTACALGKRVFLSAGRVPTAAVEPFPEHWFLLRRSDPATDMPGNVRTIQGKGPFTRDSELELLDGHRIAVVVAKMAGGNAAYAKIEAARQLGLPVVLLKRPEPPAGPMASTISEALAWLEPIVEAARGDADA